MDFPTTIYLYCTKFSIYDIISHLNTLPLPKECQILSLLDLKDTENHAFETSTHRSLLITDADFFLSYIPVPIVSKTKKTHTSTRIHSSMPMPVLGIFRYQDLPELSTDFSKIPYIFEGVESITLENLSFVFCRFHGFSLPILETKRLLLREWSVKEEQKLFDLYQDFPSSDCLPFPPNNKEERHTFLSSYIQGAYEFYGHGLWCVIEKQSNSIIGQCGIEYKERDGISRYELQYMIAPSFQQKGYGYEICNAVCLYAKETLMLSELFALILPNNYRSLGLIEKLGFHFEMMQCIEGKPTLIYKVCFPNNFSL